jgi:hypothetical protein
MGVWGTGISSNDTYADVYGDFIEAYDAGKSPTEITQELIARHSETLAIREDAPSFWYALANAQWECKSLQEDVLRKVEDLVTSKHDAKIWEELGATPAELRARDRVLSKFLAKLQTERKSPRKRRKKKLYDSRFRKGDCLVYRMTNGNYGAAFVLTDETQTETGTNYIATTTIDSPIKPTIDDFLSAEVLVRRRRKDYIDRDRQLKNKVVDEPLIWGYFESTFKFSPVDIEVVGNLPILDPFIARTPSCAGWDGLTSVLPSNGIYESLNGKPNTKVFLSDWLNPPSLLRRLFRRR